MGNFNRDGNRDNNRSGDGFNRGFGGGRPFGGGGGFGGGNRFGGRDDRPMHKAICDTCNTGFELPFKPKGDRPVYCNDCFGKKGDGNVRPNKFGGERNERHGGRPSAEFFEKREKEAKDSREVIDQLKMLNLKIDNLVRLLTPSASVEKVKKQEVKEEVAVKEVVKEKKEKTKKKVTSKKA